MIEKKLIEMLQRDELISSDEVEIIEYGLANLGSNLLGMSITLIIGFCFDFFWGSIWLWILVFPLRKNAGGYHAKTKGKCMLFSTATLLISIISFVQFKWSMKGYIIIAISLFIIIFIMVPVENCNKLLEKDELGVFKKRSRIILVSEGILFLFAIMLRLTELVEAITNVFFIVGISLVIGKVKMWSQKQQSVGVE